MQRKPLSAVASPRCSHVLTACAHHLQEGDTANELPAEEEVVRGGGALHVRGTPHQTNARCGIQGKVHPSVKRHPAVNLSLPRTPGHSRAKHIFGFPALHVGGALQSTPLQAALCQVKILVPTRLCAASRWSSRRSLQNTDQQASSCQRKSNPIVKCGALHVEDALQSKNTQAVSRSTTSKTDLLCMSNLHHCRQSSNCCNGHVRHDCFQELSVLRAVADWRTSQVLQHLCTQHSEAPIRVRHGRKEQGVVRSKSKGSLNKCCSGGPRCHCCSGGPLRCHVNMQSTVQRKSANKQEISGQEQRFA